MADLRVVAQQALEACKQRLPLAGQAAIIDELNNLRDALAQAEPVAWAEDIINDLHALHDTEMIQEIDSGAALIRLNDAIAVVEDAKQKAALAQQAEAVQRKPATGAASCVPSPSFQMNAQGKPVKPIDEALDGR